MFRKTNVIDIKKPDEGKGDTKGKEEGEGGGEGRGKGNGLLL